VCVCVCECIRERLNKHPPNHIRWSIYCIVYKCIVIQKCLWAGEDPGGCVWIYNVLVRADLSLYPPPPSVPKKKKAANSKQTELAERGKQVFAYRRSAQGVGFRV